jgi:phosphoribosylformimino-5-aminoimidazole carboxamide ribotide isomerase
MIILPAIDIKDGSCVRLYKGDFGSVQKVAEDPVETALSFQKAGAGWLHMVDLDGAKDAAPRNRQIFIDVAKATDLQVELGGGIRDLDTVEDYLSNGLARVILGSAAVKNPELVKTAVKEYGSRIAVGIDARDEMVAVDGWLDSSSVHYLDLARAMEAVGVQTIIYTDISKDGTLSGPNLSQLTRINEAVSCNIIASGGISCIDDIAALKAARMYGAICGKSLYQGTLSLEQALCLAKE